MRLIAVISLLLFLSFAYVQPAMAGGLDFMEGLAVGAGWNQGSENEANENLLLSVKSRGDRWEYGIDLCESEARGGVGDDNFAFAWVGWLEEFDRPSWQDYGIYAGGGAGFFILEDDLFDWPGSLFVILGWDFSEQAGLEGKVGYFGENNWGTATFYWYF